MGLFSTAFRSAETTDTTGATRVGGFLGGLFGLGGALSADGKSAFTLSAFYNAVDTISSDGAMLPKAVFKKQGDKRITYKEHPANYLISVEPNPMMTAFDFWKVIRVITIIKGNCYVRIVRNGSTGKIEMLRLLDYNKMNVLEKDDKLYYNYAGEIIPGTDILHFKGFSLDGKMGVGIITFAAHQLGVSLEVQQYSGEVFKNKGIAYGIVTTDKMLQGPQRDAVSEGIGKSFSQLGKYKTALLDEGMKYEKVSVTPEEAQFLETNQFGVLEVCRWLNIAPHKLKVLDNANYSNIYQQSTEHVQYTLMRWVIADEQECNRKLFTDAERGDVYVKWNINFLLRGDLDMKQKWYAAMVYAGIFTRNEVRALEDMNPLDGLDEILQPTNLDTLKMVEQKLKELQDAGN
jgi:HK97 family phage portal protein